MHKPAILLIYTGGTIGMVKDFVTDALKAFNFLWRSVTLSTGHPDYRLYAQTKEGKEENETQLCFI